MTYVIYVCYDKMGNRFETRSYTEAIKCKNEGGRYIVRYEEHHTY